MLGLILGAAWVSVVLPILGLSGWAPGRMTLTLDLVAGLPPALAGALFIAAAAVGARRLGALTPPRWPAAILLGLAALAGIALTAIAGLVLVVSALR